MVPDPFPTSKHLGEDLAFGLDARRRDWLLYEPPLKGLQRVERVR